jgi:hypothetical protein
MAARYAELTLWGTVHIWHEPQLRPEHERWRNKAGDSLVGCFGHSRRLT